MEDKKKGEESIVGRDPPDPDGPKSPLPASAHLAGPRSSPGWADVQLIRVGRRAADPAGPASLHLVGPASQTRVGRVASDPAGPPFRHLAGPSRCQSGIDRWLAMPASIAGSPCRHRSIASQPSQLQAGTARSFPDRIVTRPASMTSPSADSMHASITPQPSHSQANVNRQIDPSLRVKRWSAHWTPPPSHSQDSTSTSAPSALALIRRSTTVSSA